VVEDHHTPILLVDAGMEKEVHFLARYFVLLDNVDPGTNDFQPVAFLEEGMCFHADNIVVEEERGPEMDDKVILVDNEIHYCQMNSVQPQLESVDIPMILLDFRTHTKDERVVEETNDYDLVSDITGFRLILANGAK
jgi:hypothetical protein